MPSLTVAHGNNVLDASLGTAAFVATTTPMRCRLLTANGTGTTAGTEVTGGSYASQTVAFAAASALSAANTALLTYTLMPGPITVVGIELWDSAGTPVRKHYGPLTASKSVNSGDTFTIAASALTVNFT